MALTKIVDGFSTVDAVAAGKVIGQTMTLVNNTTSIYTLRTTSLLLVLNSPNTLQPGDSVLFVWNGQLWLQVGEAGGTGSSIVSHLDASEYGMSPSATGAANATALQSAINDAIAQSKSVSIPAGNYNIDVNATQSTGAVSVAGTVDVAGAGRGKTTLTATNYDSTAGAAMFRVTAGLWTIRFSDMTITGPAASTMALDTNISWGAWIGGGSTVYFTGVEFTQWQQCVKVSPEYPAYPGRGSKVFYKDCRIYYYVTGPLHQEGTDRAYEVAEFDNCEFEWDSAISAVTVGPTSNGQYHAMYIGQGVSLAVDNCRFLSTGGTDAGTSGYAVLHYGGSGTPRYARCTNSYFGPSVRAGILPASTTKTLVSGCTFDTGSGYSACRLRGSVDFAACEFNGEAGAYYGIIDDQSQDVTVNASVCSFGGAYLSGVQRTFGSKVWTFVNCTFGDCSAAQSTVWVNTGKVLLIDCGFTTAVGTYCLRMQGGETVLKHCHFTGTKGPYIDTFIESAVLQLDNNKWYTATGFEINAPSGSNTITIRGKGNKMYESVARFGDGFDILSTTKLSQISGDLQFDDGVGAYSYASNVLTVNWNYNTYSIDEGAGPTINNIAPSYRSAGAGVVVNDSNRFNSGRIYLHVKQAFTLGNSGNIVAAAGARAVNSIVTLQYLPAQAKWYEV